MMMIHTVAAGGGSILSFDGARMRVGPESAGADPGPACYGRGGPLAVTDANVVTGRRRPEFFPAIFGPAATAARRGGGEGRVRRDGGAGRAAGGGGGGGVPADRGREHGERDQEDQRAAGLRRLGLLPDGVRRRRGAGGLRHRRHARDDGPAWCIRWRRCSRRTAWGSPTSARRGPRPWRRRSTPGAGWRRRRARHAGRLRRSRGRGAGGAAGGGSGWRKRLLVKVQGDGHGAPDRVRRLDDPAAFQAAHRARFGFEPGDAPLVIEAAQAEAVGGAADLTEPGAAGAGAARGPGRGAGGAGVPRRGVGGGAVRAPRGVAPGDRLTGPGVLVEPHTSILVEPGWRARVTAHDHVELGAGRAADAGQSVGTRPTR